MLRPAGSKNEAAPAASVLVAACAGADHGLADSGGRIESFDLVVVGVGNPERAVVKLDAYRVLQPDVLADAVHVAERKQVESDDGLDAAHGVDGRRAYGARLAVGEEEGSAVVGDSAGLRKLRLGQRAVLDVLSAIAGVYRGVPSVQVELPELVESGHGYV